MTIEPSSGIRPLPPPPEPPLFGWGNFIGGLVTALVIGGLLNVVAVVVGSMTGWRILMVLFGTIPGLAFALSSKLASDNGFAEGLLIGGSIIALIGGTCGAVFSID